MTLLARTVVLCHRDFDWPGIAIAGVSSTEAPVPGGSGAGTTSTRLTVFPPAIGSA